jgi:hypothetical protein
MFCVMIPLPLEMLSWNEAEVFTSPEVTTYLWRPAHGIMVSRVEGVITPEPGLAIENMMKRVAAEDGALLMFHDWERMVDYHTQVRLRLTATGAGLQGVLEHGHILVRSGIVALGVKAANLVVPALTVHTERAPFEAALRDALARPR